MNVIRNNIGFASVFSILAGYVVIAMLSCTDSVPDNEKLALLGTESHEGWLLRADAALHQRLQAVHEADDQYDALLTGGPASTAALDAKNGQIIQAEMALQQTIDSLKQTPLNKIDSAGNGLSRLTDYFKATLENRRFLSDMRMIASADSDDSTTMQRTLLRLRAELQEKGKRLSQLEQVATTRTRQPALDLPSTATPLERKLLAPERARLAEKDGRYAPANGESLQQLKQRNQNLAAALNAIQTQYGTLSKYYRQLKQDYDRLQNELTAVRKQGSH